MPIARGRVGPCLGLLPVLLCAATLSCGGPPASRPGTVSGPENVGPSPVLRLAARRERPLEGKPIGVVSLDVDGDGTAEVLSTILEPGGVVALHHAGSRGSLRTIAQTTSYPLRVEVVPGHDGPILALVERMGARLSVFRPESFREPILQRVLGAAPRALDAERIDGAWCVAVACDGGDLVVEREKAPARTVKLASTLPRAVRVLRDGAGIAVAFQDTRDLVVWGLDEDRELLTHALPGLPRDVVESDIDGDGEAELIIAGGENSLWVFGWDRPGGARSWIEAGEAPLEWRVGEVPVDIEPVDLDRDGKEELIVVCAAGLTAEVLGDFTRSGPTYRNSIHAGQTPLDSCSGDFDGDGALDLALANRDSLAVSFLMGSGGRSFRDGARIAVGSFPNRLVCGNLLGDPAPELATLNGKDGSVTILDPAGQSSHSIDLPEGSLPIAAVAADFWNDGGDNHPPREELAVLIEGNGSSRCDLYRSSPWELAGSFALPGGCTDAVALEADGEGGIDLIVVDAQAERLWLLLNQMTGSRTESDPPFVLSQELALPSGPCALERFELHQDRLPGDTLPSVAVALCGPGPRMGFACLFVDRSGEGGVALVEREFYGVEGTPIDIAAEDFNGDGSEDVAVIASVTQESPQGFVQVFLRQEHGFHALEPLPCGLKPRHVAAGDLDFDGRAEIAVASQNSHVVNLLRLSSSGELERLDDAGAGIGCLDLALVDVDLDGALDLLVANAFSNDVSVVLNQTRP